MKDLIAVAGRAKQRVDTGFSRVGKKLKAGDLVEKSMMVLSARAISTANAAAILCREGQPNEALILLRAVAELSILMRWISAGDAAARAAEVWPKLQAPRWDAWLTDDVARGRAKEFFTPDWAVAATFDSAPDFVHGNATGLPWGHVFGSDLPPGRSSEAVLAAVSIWLALVLEALDRRWPGEFPGASEIRDTAQSLRGTTS